MIQRVEDVVDVQTLDLRDGILGQLQNAPELGVCGFGQRLSCPIEDRRSAILLGTSRCVILRAEDVVDVQTRWVHQGSLNSESKEEGSAAHLHVSLAPLG